MSHWLTITTRMKGYGLQCAQSVRWGSPILPSRFCPGIVAVLGASIADIR